MPKRGPSAWRWGVLSVLLLSAAALGLPDGMPSLLRSVEAARKSKEPLRLVDALQAALVAARAKAPLVVAAVAVVQQPHTGLGLYTPLVDDVVQGRDVWLYVEVENFGHQPVSGGEEIALTASATFTFVDGAERVPLKTPVSLGTTRFATHRQLGVTSFGAQMHLSDKMPVGEYLGELRVLDEQTQKSAIRSFRFVLR